MSRLLFLFFFLPLFTQGQHRYWILLEDKAPSGYSLSHPEEFLSSRAVQRRQQQGIPITREDLPVARTYLKQLKEHGISVIHTSRWFNRVSAYIPDSLAIFRIRALDFVQEVRPVRSMHRPSVSLPKGGPVIQDFAPPSEHQKRYGSAFPQIALHNGQYLHDLGFTGKGLHIAVIDAGFKPADQMEGFAHLFEEGRIAGTRDFVDQETNVYDDHWHGANVLSALAGMAGDTILGTAPDADYWLLRSENAAYERVTEEDNWVAAAEYADSVGVDIINTSLGYTTFDDPSEDHSYSDMDGNTTLITQAADKAASKGILVVTSAGNAGNTSWYHIGAPADGDSVLTVGAVGKDSTVASFSSHGPAYDGRIKPDVMAVGIGTYLTSSQNDAPFPANGTSFSAPIIAGMSACLWQAYPEKGNMELLRAIQKHAHASQDPNNERGFGIPDFFSTYRSFSSGPSPAMNAGSLLVYPNPVRQTAYLRVPPHNSRKGLLQVYTLEGELLAKKEVAFPISGGTLKVKFLSFLPRGTYLLRLTTPTRSFTKKLVRY